LLSEAGRWDTGIFREPRGRGTSAIDSHYQTTAGEGIADWEDLVRAVVKWHMCDLAIALQLLVVTICKWSINSITNPNLIYSHAYMWHYFSFFKNPVSNSRLYSAKWLNDSKQWIQKKGCGRTWSWPKLRYKPKICLDGLR
jgi:hypothetical protein